MSDSLLRKIVDKNHRDPCQRVEILRRQGREQRLLLQHLRQSYLLQVLSQSVSSMSSSPPLSSLPSMPSRPPGPPRTLSSSSLPIPSSKSSASGPSSASPRPQLQKQKSVPSLTGPSKEGGVPSLALSEAEQRIYNRAMTGDREKVLVRWSGGELRSGDLRRLREGQWLNDELINGYMHLVAEASGGNVAAMSSFFVPLLRISYARVQRWTRGKDVLACSKILVPVHEASHWTLAVIDLARRRLQYYDSLGGSGKRCLQLLREWVAQEHLSKRGAALNMASWKMETVHSAPKQRNGSDCGVFLCQYARGIAAEVPLIFSQRQMPLFRQRMLVDLLNQQLS